MNYSILPRTSLAAIVRDEAMNPAGGVEKFLRSVLPHVESAVVVDTGSVDGTKDVLNDLSREYPHMKIFYTKFAGFAKSRNFSLSKVVTKRALVMDADELLTHDDYGIMSDFMRHYPVWGYWFPFRNIYPDGGTRRLLDFDVMNPRLFNVRDVKYKYSFIRHVYEDIPFGLSANRMLDALVEIKHFLPSREAEDRKKQNWYLDKEFLKISPFESAQRDGWKDFNPRRNLYD